MSYEPNRLCRRTPVYFFVLNGRHAVIITEDVGEAKVQWPYAAHVWHTDHLSSVRSLPNHYRNVSQEECESYMKRI